MTATSNSHLRAQRETALTVFSFLWGSAALFSLLAAWPWAGQLILSFPSATAITDALVATTAMSLLLRPQSLTRLGLLSGAQIAQTFARLPDVPNHRTVMCFINIAILVAILSAALSGGRKSARESLREQVFLRFVPTARVSVIVVYAYALLAKLNWDYTNPAHSCCSQFYGNVLSWTRIFPDNTATMLAIIWTTIVIEALLPLFLGWRRFRIAGVLLGLVFHLGLSFDLVKLFLNFSAVMSSLLILFLPEDAFSTVAERWGAFIQKSRLKPVLSRIHWLAFACHALLIGGCFAMAGTARLSPAYPVVLEVLWATYSLVLISGVVVYVKQRLGLPTPAAAGLRVRGAQWIVVSLVILNGLCPYLGIKTRTSFNMYSNLRIEPAYSNHFFMPRSLDLLGNVGDSVAILHTNDPQLRRQFQGSSVELTWFEFSRYVGLLKEINVVYRRNGKVHLYLGATADSPIQPPPWIQRKLLIYRPVGDGIEKSCIW